MDVEQLGHAAGPVIARLAKHVEQAISPLELSLPQYRLLGFLAAGSTASSALAERMAVTPPTVTSLSDGLVARALIERRSDPKDRRRLPLALTPAGEKLLRKANLAVGERLRAIAEHAGGPGAVVGLTDWQSALDGYRDAKTLAAAKEKAAASK